MIETRSKEYYFHYTPHGFVIYDKSLHLRVQSSRHLIVTKKVYESYDVGDVLRSDEMISAIYKYPNDKV